MRRLSLALILLAVLSALAACGGGAQQPPTAAPARPAVATQAPAGKGARATEAPKPTATPPATATKAPVPTATPTAEEALPVPKPAALKSYVARIELKSEVTEPEPGLEAWSVIEITYRLDPAPTAYRMTVTDKTGQARPEMEIIIIGQETYMKDPDGDTWMKLTVTGGFGDLMQIMVDPEELTRDAPTDIFSQANVVSRNEIVEGVPTTHYRATEAQIRALMARNQVQTGQEQKIISAVADFWVARQGNYLKQYRTETVHEEADGRQLKTVMQMLVTDENKPVTIEPPPADKVTEMGGMPPAETPESEEPEAVEPPSSPEAAAALAALPVPPRSKEYKPAELPGGIRLVVVAMAEQGPVRAFLSDASVDEITAFYKAELPKLGYQSVMQMPGGSSVYQKGDQMILIQIGEDPQAGKTYVIIQMP